MSIPNPVHDYHLDNFNDAADNALLAADPDQVIRTTRRYIAALRHREDTALDKLAARLETALTAWREDLHANNIPTTDAPGTVRTR